MFFFFFFWGGGGFTTNVLRTILGHRSVQMLFSYVDYCVVKDECTTNNSLTMAKKGVLKSLAKRLSDKTNADNPLRTMSHFYVRIPLCCLHLSHPVGGSATMRQYVDKRILDKIYELANHNVTNVAEVKRCLDRYVENEVFGDVAGAKKPKKTNRRYYPSRKDLRNHIARAISAQKYCDDDQESLRLKIRDWQERSPQTRFFYRTRDDPPASSDPAGKNSSEERKTEDQTSISEALAILSIVTRREGGTRYIPGWGGAARPLIP